MKNVTPTVRAKRGTLPALLAASLALALLLGACSRRDRDARGDLVLSGNLDVTDAQVGFKTAGRMIERTVSEGDRVTAGQLIARLDDSEQKAQLALREAELKAAQAGLAELEAGSRPEEIAAAAATVHSAEAERDRARLDFARQQDLRHNDAISERDFESVQAGLKVAEARVVEAKERLKLAQQGPRIETIRQAHARVAQARAAVDLATIQLDNTRLLSPLTGVVLSDNTEPGEFVSPGTPVVTVADIDHVWVRAYVDETDLGRVRLGQAVKVRTDSFPGRDFPGTVSFISSEAEFTPKTVQTDKERVKLVFRIKVDVANDKGELKPGMPADVLIPPAN